MQKFILYLTFALCLCILPGCSDEPEQARLFSDNNSEVTINTDGTTSTGVPYSPFGKQSFFLDHIIYAIDGDHALIIGYSSKLIAEHVRPYAYITYDGVRYPVTEILPEALANSERIKSIELPTTLTTIEECAFIKNKNLISVQFPNKKIEFISNDIFYGCEHLENVYLPEGIKAIPGGIFEECSGLKHFIIPESVKKINGFAFYNCISLESITIPANVTSIGDFTFGGCTNLKHVTSLNPIPPKCYNFRPFSGVPKDAVLYVPAASVENYKYTLYWRDFANIVGI